MGGSERGEQAGAKGSQQQGPSEQFVKQVYTAIFSAAFIWLLILFLGRVSHLLLLLFAGILIAVFLRGTGLWLSRLTRIPPKIAQVAVLLVIIGLGTVFVWLVSPRVSQQYEELSSELPQAYQSFKETVQGSEWGRELIRKMPDSKDMSTQIGAVLKRAGGIFTTTFGILSSVVIVLFIGLYLAFNPELYVNGLIRLVPMHRRERAGEILRALNETLLDWMVARFIGMTVVGLLTWVGLMLLGIPLALSLGLLAALLTFIPNIGPIVSVIPAMLLGLSQGWSMAFYVLALYAGIQALESYVLTPMVQQYAVSLPPALTITLQVSLGILAGILGLILATPLAAVVLVLVQMIYVHDILGDRSISPKN